MQLTITASILALIVYGRLLWIDFDSDKYTRVHALIKWATLFVSMVLNFEAANTARKARERIHLPVLTFRRVEKPKKPRPLEVYPVITRTAACVKHVQSRLQWQLT